MSTRPVEHPSTTRIPWPYALAMALAMALAIAGTVALAACDNASSGGADGGQNSNDGGAVDAEVPAPDGAPQDASVDAGPPAPQPLTVHAGNPRYLDDGSGRAVLLVGVNHGWELVDNAWREEYVTDWTAHLDYLESYNLNYIRMWRAESPQQTVDDPRLGTPMAYLRTGPALANDGELRFDLTQPNPAYFDRLRQRCIAAGDRGIYVAIMFFERHSTYNNNGPTWPWDGHPFHAANNVNSIDADTNGDGEGREYFLMPADGGDADVLALQETLVRHTIDAVADLDNVLFEICNESQPEANAWQLHMLDVARDHMDTLPATFLLGFTGPGTFDNGTFPDFDIQLQSSADFVSPRNNTTYRNNPPAADGSKVIFADSDHITPLNRDAEWVWKSFTRGLHPQALEPFVPADSSNAARDELVRQSLGFCLEYADRMDLAAMIPGNPKCSSRYCLVNLGTEYLVFVPDGGPVDVDLADVSGNVAVEWLAVQTATKHAGTSAPGGRTVTFTPPFAGHAVLYLEAE